MIEELLNPWIRDLVPYSSARSEFSGRADVFLDANESWEGPDSGINRYPDPFCRELRQAIAGSMGFPFDMTAIGNGSDEIIDLLIRMFAYPGRDAIMVERPTYGTYSVFASISGVEVIDVPLTPSLDLDENAMIDTVNRRKPKIVFICSPNNPTGRVYPLDEILRIADANKGITVVDEAYASSARVMLVTSTRCNVGARILRANSRAVGIVAGRGGDNVPLLMEHLPREAEVYAGDVVVTSGYSQNHPSGIVIGTVKESSLDAAGLLRNATIEPAAVRSGMEEVFVVIWHQQDGIAK